MKRDESISTIRWAQPSLTDDDYRALQQCFDTHWLSQGPKVREFEGLVASATARDHCVAVNSGSSALLVTLLALGIGRDSEVIIPAMSFIAVPSAVALLGATPVLADISRHTGMLDVESVAEALSPATAAVVAIDYSGFTGDWSELSEVCDARGIPLIVDAASSFLATWEGKPAGSWGEVSTFSFHSAKVITTGEGGAIVTDDDVLARRLRRIRNHGEIPDAKYRYDTIGGNFRMMDLTAAFGISQFARKEDLLERRQQVLRHYLQNDDVRQAALPLYHRPDHTSNGVTFTVLTEHRDRIAAALARDGIETRSMWPDCVDEQPTFEAHGVRSAGSLDNARWFTRRCLSLPVHLGLSPEDVRHITALYSKECMRRPWG